MSLLTVHTAECPKLTDGRARHVYVRVDGEFTCANCGQLSDPAQRWEPTKEAAARSAASPDRRLAGLPSPGDHASLPESQSARHSPESQDIRTRVAIPRPRKGGQL